MSILIFLIILSALIIVHELGHFLVARFFGIRVDEFGLGFPPRATKLFTWKNTPFTLNWLPFGGFVKIFGENPDSEEGDTMSIESFASKNRGIQSGVLVAGVVGNLLFAWALFSLGFLTGIPAPANSSLPVEDARTVVTTVLPGSPAAEAGIKSGDAIVSLTEGGVSSGITPKELSLFIAESDGPLVFGIERGGEITEKIAIPEEGIISDRPAVGISMEVIGIAKLPFHKALWHGLKTTLELTIGTARAIGSFIFQALGGKANLSGITGPVGIVGMVGDARELGFGYLLTFTALISINLSIINLLPFPALDGGRLLFVGIEVATRRTIPAKVANIANGIGFALLIFLMVLITISDVRNIF